ncbi:uncharacterized protein F5Z01DRAFT_644983, partial [Emericellopsis atlantica]
MRRMRTEAPTLRRMEYWTISCLGCPRRISTRSSNEWSRTEAMRGVTARRPVLSKADICLPPAFWYFQSLRRVPKSRFGALFLHVVNVGDSLRFLSKFRLQPCLHRVAPCHERWTSGPRYSIIYFLRPSDDAEFVDSEGAHWTGRGWLHRKFGNYRLTHEEQG